MGNTKIILRKNKKAFKKERSKKEKFVLPYGIFSINILT
jgi:hypothetical protein